MKYYCKHCGEMVVDTNNGDSIHLRDLEEELWGHIQMEHEDVFEEVQDYDTPDMLEECYDEDGGYFVKYFLDIDPFDQDVFVLKTCLSHDVVFEGRFSEITGDVEAPWDILDEHFEKELGIKSEEWVVG